MPNSQTSPKLADGLRPQAAVGVVCVKDGQVLLIRRGTPPMTGEWSLPGGRVEPGEPVRVAALRELFEETGVTADLAGLIDVVDAIVKTRDGTLVTRHFVLSDFAAVWTGGEPVAGDDAADARFFEADALDDIDLWDETRRVVREGLDLVAKLSNARN
jgi:8-oxo-dGTP diphosphatase